MAKSKNFDGLIHLSKIKAAKHLLREAANGSSFTGFLSALRTYQSTDSSVQAIQFCANRIKQFVNANEIQSLRIAILSSFTLELVEPALRVSEFCAGRDLSFRNFPYDQWAMALNSTGELDKFQPDVVFLILHLEDVAPLLAREHLVASQNELDEEATRLMGLVQSCIKSFRIRQSVPVVLSTFIAQERGVERFFDRAAHVSKVRRICSINDQLSKIVSEFSNVYVFDYAEMVSDFGRSSWFDRVAHHHTHASVSSGAMNTLADEMTSFLSAMFGQRRKVLAVDLDNTLWHGIVGEDGPNGVDAGGMWPGNAHRDFQSFLKNLRASGILLVLLSKNNEADALDGFEMNRRMPLSLSDFSVVKIDWNDKASNLMDVAKDLNLAPDSFVFMDDNPLEIALMQEQRPEVATVLAEGTASNFQSFILGTDGLLSPGLTEEDLGRADDYAVEEVRNRQQSTSNDIESFLAGLELCLEYRSPMRGELERVTQLFARTNQFNLTTIRYTYADVLSFIEDPNTALRIVRLEDRFGDYGLVGIVVIRSFGDDFCQEIDSFLMSCRVLGRQVEDSILTIVENDARRAGVRQLVGRYCETKKNHLVANFYLDRGFQSDDEAGIFKRDLIKAIPMTTPEWIKVKRDG